MSSMRERNKSDWPVILIGLFLVTGGVFCAVCAAFEFPAFALFSTGRQAYNGFGFGSFMFAVIVFFIYFYSSSAYVLIIIGIGFLLHRWWAARLSECVLLLLGILGAVLMINVMLLFTDIFSSFSGFGNRIEPGQVAGVFAILACVFFIIPTCALFVLKLNTIKNSLRISSRVDAYVSGYPHSVLLILVMEFFLFISCTFSFFIKSYFPLFGLVLTDVSGTAGLTILMAALATIIFFTIRMRPFAWWLNILLFLMLLVSSLFTYWKYSFIELCGFLGFPAEEMRILNGIFILKDYKAVFFFSSPFMVLLILLFISKRHFNRSRVKK